MSRRESRGRSRQVHSYRDSSPPPRGVRRSRSDLHPRLDEDVHYGRDTGRDSGRALRRSATTAHSTPPPSNRSTMTAPLPSKPPMGRQASRRAPASPARSAPTKPAPSGKQAANGRAGMRDSSAPLPDLKKPSKLSDENLKQHTKALAVEEQTKVSAALVVRKLQASSPAPKPSTAHTEYNQALFQSRPPAEMCSLWDIAKGFVYTHWSSFWKPPFVELVKRGEVAGDPHALCDKIVDDFGIYVLMAKPPGAKDYVCCYLGKAGPAPGQFSMETVKQKFHNVYLHHKDGSFGPANEPRLYLTLMDLQRRGFSIAVRFRAVRGLSARADEAEKLADFNFAYNLQGQRHLGHRHLMLPGGRRVANYPVIMPDIDAVYKKVAKKNKKVHSIESVE